MLDKDTSLAEKIQTLFCEQGIMIASILMAIRMAISALVETLLPGGGEEVAKQVSLHLKIRQERKNGSEINLKPWRGYWGD